MTDGRPYNVHVYGNYCFNKPAPGKNSPPPPPKKNKTKKNKNNKKKNNDTPAPSLVNAFWTLPYLPLIFGHRKCLFKVPYISGHVPNRVFLLSVNVRTPKTCPLFLIKLLFFTTGIFCIFALFICVSGKCGR